jgi:nicotinamide-nucleotide amidase
VALIDFDDALLLRVDMLGAALRSRGWRMAAAESCTGGLLAASCTAVAGSSDWFEAGWVTYSNAAKTVSLGVPAGLIEAHGAVSAEVVEAMARGAIAHSGARLAVAISGIAGPSGGSADKPVGTVWVGLAWAVDFVDGDDGAPGVAMVEAASERLQLDGGRHAVREQSVSAALAWLQYAADHGHGRRP